MGKIVWCLKQIRGITLIEPNENLKFAYFLKANDALETLRTSQVKDWKLTTAYYAIYHSLYAILQGIGIKSEIHRCTIAFVKEFLKEYLSKEDLDLIEMSFLARNNSQYYTDREISDEKVEWIIKGAPLLLVKCKHIVLKQQVIEHIRSELIKLKR